MLITLEKACRQDAHIVDWLTVWSTLHFDQLIKPKSQRQPKFLPHLNIRNNPFQVGSTVSKLPSTDGQVVTNVPTNLDLILYLHFYPTSILNVFSCLYLHPSGLKWEQQFGYLMLKVLFQPLVGIWWWPQSSTCHWCRFSWSFCSHQGFWIYWVTFQHPCWASSWLLSRRGTRQRACSPPDRPQSISPLKTNNPSTLWISV